VSDDAILIVDDEVRVLDSLEALLAMDYRVLRADRPAASKRWRPSGWPW
jgi:response regulator RpfG family c-di-GMP phosphodiesterase